MPAVFSLGIIGFCTGMLPAIGIAMPGLMAAVNSLLLPPFTTNWPCRYAHSKKLINYLAYICCFSQKWKMPCILWEFTI